MGARAFCRIALLLSAFSAAAEAATFEDTGGAIPGGNVRFSGMSGDGGTLVGSTPGETLRARRWRPGGFWANLGTLPGNTSASATAVNFDGRVIAGRGDVSAAIRFIERVGWENLALSSGTRPEAMSADGSVIVGDFLFGSGTFVFSHVELWVEGVGATIIRSSGGAPAVGVSDLTADGATLLVTNSFVFGVSSELVTQDGTGTGLPSTPQNGVCVGGVCSADGRAISPDGGTVVGGVSLDAFGFAPLQAARWPGAEGPILLGFLDPDADDPTSVALDVSNSGSVIVGSSDRRGFVWTQARGMRDMKEALEATGLDLTGWTLESSSAVSDDGTVFAGTGTNPDGDFSIWYAVAPELSVPEPSRFALQLTALLTILAVSRWFPSSSRPDS